MKRRKQGAAVTTANIIVWALIIIAAILIGGYLIMLGITAAGDSLMR